MNSIQDNIKRPIGLDRDEDLKLPPVVRYFEAERVRTVENKYEHRDESGRLHNDSGYAVLRADGSTECWRHGHAHSVDDVPAITVGPDGGLLVPVPLGLSVHLLDDLSLEPGARVWCDDGVIHRDGNAAVEMPNNFREYWHQGRRHRNNGPAYIRWEERWYYHGLIHRSDGPAVVFPKGKQGSCGEWVWYGDVFCTPDRLGEGDFPFHEPPPEFYATALASMEYAPDFPPKAESIVVARVGQLMPDFPSLWSLRHACGWDEIRRSLAMFLSSQERGCTSKLRRKRKAKVELLALPAGIFDEDYPAVGGTATDGKVV
jgi:hypothetical protein